MSYFRPQWTILSDFCGYNGHFICADWFYDDQKCAGLDNRGENIEHSSKTTVRKIIYSVRYEKCHNLGLSWPILVIFLANMVISIVLIGSMMTRTFCITIKVGRIGLEGYWVTGHYTRPILWGHGGLRDLKTSTFFNFFGIFRILTSNGTRKCFGSKEKSNFCKMKHPNLLARCKIEGRIVVPTPDSLPMTWIV